MELPDVAEILRLQREFDEVELAGDPARARSLLAEDFRSIGEQGFLLDKEQWLAVREDFRFLTLETSQVDVQRYERTAIVRAVQSGRALWQGTELTLRVRLSQVWVQLPDGWKLAALQFSPLPAATPS